MTMTREQWLNKAISLLGKEFFSGEHQLPKKLLASTGWPKHGGKEAAIGQCFHQESSADAETVQIFICPTQGDGMRVLDIMLHELCHAVLGHGVGHKGAFKKLAREIGLEGKLTATIVTPASPAYPKLQAVLAKLGDYPHVVLQPSLKEKRPGGGGWVRYKSVDEEGFKVLVSPKMVEAFGAPQDPWGVEMVPVDAEGGEDGE